MKHAIGQGKVQKREHQQIQNKLQAHKELMDKFIAQGMSKADASKKAFQQI